MQAYLGIDIGGTAIKLGIRRESSNKLEFVKSYPTPSSLPLVIPYILKYKEWLEGKKIAVSRIGVTMPGNFNYRSGILVESKRFGVKNFPITLEIKRIYPGCPAAILNDGQAAGLAELFFGQGKNFPNFIFLGVGTSIGGSIVLNHKVVTSTDGRAIGRVAHMVIDPNGRKCRCGNTGCWETYVGTDAIVRLAFEKFGMALSPKELYERAKLHNRQAQFARKIFQDIARWLTIGAGNLVNMLSLDAVIFGGGVMNAQKFILPTVKKLLPKIIRERAVVLASHVGDKASLLGATVVAQYQDKIHSGNY